MRSGKPLRRQRSGLVLAARSSRSSDIWPRRFVRDGVDIHDLNAYSFLKRSASSSRSYVAKRRSPDLTVAERGLGASAAAPGVVSGGMRIEG